MIAQLESVCQFLNFIHYFEGIFENNIIDLFMKTHSKNLLLDTVYQPVLMEVKSTTNRELCQTVAINAILAEASNLNDFLIGSLKLSVKVSKWHV